MKTNTLWAIWGNGYGLKGPCRVFRNEELKSWYAKNGNDDVNKIGLDWGKNNYYFSFASKNKNEVLMFLKGYRSCAQIVKNATMEKNRHGMGKRRSRVDRSLVLVPRQRQ